MSSSLSVRAMSPTGDMTFGQGSGNFLINNSAAVAQILGTRFRLWQTEWFLDLSAGVPYMSDVVGYGNMTMGILILENYAIASPGVISITGWSLQYNAQTRKLTITASNLNTQFGSSTFPTVTTIAPTNS